MLKLIKWPGKNIWGGLFIFIRTLGALAMQKLIAVLYGPAGTTLFSHFQNLISLFTQPVQDVVAQGIINAYPNKAFSRKSLYHTAIIALLILFFSTSIILGLTNSFSNELFTFSFYKWCLIILAILVLCFQSIASAILIGQQKLKTLSFIHLIQWTVIISFLLYLKEPLSNTLLYYLVILALFTIIFYACIFSELKHFRLANYSIDKKVIHHFKQFLLMGLAVWLSSKWVDYFIREYAIELFGQSETGYWQAVVRISEAYRGLFISFLLITFYPAISKLFNNNLKSLKTHVIRQMRLISFLSTLFFVFVYLLHPQILQMLYSVDYLAASPLFKLQIFGDVIAFLSFPLALVLMATVQTKAYVICEIVSATTYVLCIYLGSDLGIKILVLAHITRFISYFFLVLFFTHKSLKIA